MLIRNKFNGYSRDGSRVYPGGGGGTNTSYTTNIPEYLQPYAETMLGATQQQLFNTKDGQVTGFRPFAPYGAAIDDQGNILNTAQDQAKAAVAGFSPLQQQALSGMANMKVPGQTEAASQMTANLAGRSLGAGQYDAGTFGTSSFNAPAATPGGQSTAASYMSPYMQNVVDIQTREAQRQADIAGTQRGAQAAGAGAFGGSRQAIMDAEAARNLATQKGDIQAQGSQAAYQQAQAQFNAEQQRTQQAQQMAEQSKQYGAGLGMQGIQQAGSMAAQLGGLGQQQYSQQMGLLGAQNQAGAQQQQLEQARINQAMQNYATQQQYPLMQLGVMSNMLRGLPMQASTTSSYAAQPSVASQFAGAAGTGMTLANQAKQFGFAKGGAVKSMAAGGIATGVNPDEMPYIAKKMGDQQIGQKLGDAATDNETKSYLKAEADFRKQARNSAMAAGGVIAFEKGSKDAVEDEDKKELGTGERQMEGILAGLREKLTEAPPANVAPPPVVAETPAPPVTDAPAAPVASVADANADMMAPPIAPAGVPTAGGIAGMPELKASAGALELEKLRAARQVEADKPLEQRLQEQNELKKKFGIDPQFLQDAIDKQEKRKTDLQGEAKEEAMNRFTEFLMTWGSTPGPTMVAAAKAGREYIANTNLDKKERKRLLAEADGVITDLNKSIYLEKSGSFKDAQAEQIRAGENLFNISKTVAEIQEGRGATEFGAKAGAARDAITANAAMARTMAQMQSEEARAAAKGILEKELKRMEVNKRTDYMNGVAINYDALIASGEKPGAATIAKASSQYLKESKQYDIRAQTAEASQTQAATAQDETKRKLSESFNKAIFAATSLDEVGAARMAEARAADKRAGVKITEPNSQTNKVLNAIKAETYAKPEFELIRPAAAKPAAAAPAAPVANPDLSDESALNWAKSNPDDPRSALILKKAGAK
jgi:hypothetical protein